MFVPFTYIFVCCNDMRESSDYNNFYLGLRNFAIAIAIASVKLHKSQHRMQFFMHGETNRHVPARLVTSQAPNVSGGFSLSAPTLFPNSQNTPLPFSCWGLRPHTDNAPTGYTRERDLVRALGMCGVACFGRLRSGGPCRWYKVSACLKRAEIVRFFSFEIWSHQNRLLIEYYILMGDF